MLVKSKSSKTMQIKKLALFFVISHQKTNKRKKIFKNQSCFKFSRMICMLYSCLCWRPIHECSIDNTHTHTFSISGGGSGGGDVELTFIHSGIRIICNLKTHKITSHHHIFISNDSLTHKLKRQTYDETSTSCLMKMESIRSGIEGQRQRK